MARLVDRSWEPKFIEHLRHIPVVSRAAHACGIESGTAQRHRKLYKLFAVAWEEALEAGLDGVEVKAYEGVVDAEQPSENLAKWILSRRRPDKWGAHRENAPENVTPQDMILPPPVTPAEAGSRWVSEWKHTPAHLQYISNEISSVLWRPRRLVITVPVRHGKTTLCSWATPLWFLSQRPQGRLLVTAHGADFARSWGRRVRDSIEEYPESGLTLHKSAGEMHSWELETGGGLHTAGVGGSVTGRGFDLIIVDDPVKNIEDAYSETYREKTWDWFQGTLQSRLAPNGSIVILMSRWHEDDLVGRLFDDDFENEKYDLIHLQALCEDEATDPFGRKEGAALWPEGGQTVEHLDGRRQAAGSVMWSANWQGRPAPLEGNLFRVENWNYLVGDLPEGVDVRAWDLAASEKGDYTVGVLMRLCDNGVIVVRDVERFRLSPGARDARIRLTAERDGQSTVVSVPDDPGAAGTSQVTYIKRDVLQGYKVHASPETGDKVIRAIPYAARQETGRVWLVRSSWNRLYVDELSKVAESGKSGARHDDQVDASSRGHSFLTNKLKARFW